MHRDVWLRRPAQYSELLQHVRRHFGQDLLMEFAISNGEVSTAVVVIGSYSCQSAD